MRATALALLVLLMVPAQSHWRDDSSMDVLLEGTKWTLDWRVPKIVVAFADENGDGQLDQAELDTHQSRLLELLKIGLEVKSDSIRPRFELLLSPQEGSQTHVAMRLELQWPQEIDFFDFHYKAFPKDLYGEEPPRCLAVFRLGEHQRSFALDPDRPSLRFELKAPRNDPEPILAAESPGFVSLGVEHILSGWDHLLFVLCLVLPGGTWWQLAKVITAFTVAHSITLGLAALGYITLPPLVVEVVIALSISAAALYVFRGEGDDRRTLLAGSFGLIHGLGFASVLQQLLSLEGDHLVWPLLGFNVGVELGQLAALVVMVPLLNLMRTREWGETASKGLALAIAAVGLGLAVHRILTSWPPG